MNDFDLLPLLDYIPADDYEIWCNVGMALKHEGYSCADWDRWSMKSGKYESGECEKKWNTFNENTIKIVTGATITKYAKDFGWKPKDRSDDFLAWDAVIGTDKKVKSIVDEGLVEKEPVPPAPTGGDWKPGDQLSLYLNTLFEPDDIVAYVVLAKQREKDEKWFPADSGVYKFTAKEIKGKIDHYHGDLRYTLGDYNKEAGAWIRINPMDGNGVMNTNVADFRYALVESDSLSIEKQYNLIKQMKLPVAVLVHSGGKSLHAIVKINAPDITEYSKRVQYLYQVCEKSGLKVDSNNKNPSRLSRMPGIERAGKKQYIIATNMGCESWEKWVEYVTLLDNSLPDPQNLAELLKNPPPLADAVIDGILRQGHKMLIAGASKAGKSFLLMELCIALSKGGKWLRWQCKQGKVLYVNLEIDFSSCINRFATILEAKHLNPNISEYVEIMPLRGQSAPLDQLVDKLIFKTKDAHYSVIIIDPIYKVITGDENSASDMAHFTNQFDKIAEALGCSVIYCHHHSKGSQDGKRVTDRASGSGVFSRDADALIDMIELEISSETRDHIKNQKLCSYLCDYYENVRGKGWDKDLNPKIKTLSNNLVRMAHGYVEEATVKQLENKAKADADAVTAWRIEGTLREFPRFAPLNIWFDYPVHSEDTEHLLDNAQPIGAINPHIKGGEAAHQAAQQKKQDKDLRMKKCFDELKQEHEEVDARMLHEAVVKSCEEDHEKVPSWDNFRNKWLKASKRLKTIGRTQKGKGSIPSLVVENPDWEEELFENTHEDLPDDFGG